MKIKRTTCCAVAVLLLCLSNACLAASESSGQDDAVKIVLDILRSNDQEMQAAAIAMVKEMSGKDVTEALAKELPNLSPASRLRQSLIKARRVAFEIPHWGFGDNIP